MIRSITRSFLFHGRKAALVAFPAMALLVALSRDLQGQSKPSVILISVDTLRADRLSSYGYKRLQTPNIDGTAKGGTLFSQASAQVPLTMPSHASLFTSTYQFANGVEDNGQPLQANSTTLASVLQSRGYRTGAFLASFVLDRRFGLDQGFDDYDSSIDLHRHPGTDPGEIKRPAEEVVAAAQAGLGGGARGSRRGQLCVVSVRPSSNRSYRRRRGTTCASSRWATGRG